MKRFFRFMPGMIAYYVFLGAVGGFLLGAVASFMAWMILL